MSSVFSQVFDKLNPSSFPFPHPISFFPLVIFIIALCKWLVNTNATAKNLPPSPPSLPILGNLLQLGKLPHRSLWSLSQRYGDLMSLRLGSKPTLVVSSADSAREIMKTHDLIFSNRPKTMISSIILYGGKDLVFSNYGEYWRQMKSICVLQMFSNKKVRSFRRIREEEVSLMVEMIKKSLIGPSVPVDLSEMITVLTNSVTCRAAFGRKYAGQEGVPDIGKIVADLSEAFGTISMGDLIPGLAWINKLNGMEKKAHKLFKLIDGFVEMILQEHLDRGNTQSNTHDDDNKGEKEQDFVDILIQVQRENPSSLHRDDIKALLLDMIAAGTETIYTLLEWAMTELLMHPKVMQNLQHEVRGIITDKPGLVSEKDLEDMKYLKSVIKETLRLHPPLPLLVFRESSQDVKICGYDIASKTQVIINAWAIQRDPAYWDKPEKFHPERFLNSSIDFKGQHFEFIPFGAGRRGCPAATYASVNAELVLANLVYNFNWKLPGQVEELTFEVAESSGFAVRRQDPLLAIPTLYTSG